MKYFLYIFLFLLFFKCDVNIKKAVSLNIISKGKKYKIGDTLKINMKTKQPINIDSVFFYLDNQQISNNYVFEKDILGKKKIEMRVFFKGKKYSFKKIITLFAKRPPQPYTYEIINEFPHDEKAYTQGLEFYGDTLYESTGLRGYSSLRKMNFRTGEVYKKITLDNHYFGEGMSIFNDKIFQLTWQEFVGIIYNMNLEAIGQFSYEKSKEGWGLCNDGKYFYKSDGTSFLWILDTVNLKEIKKIQVMTHKNSIKNINELEFVNGKIYANTYQYNKEVVLIINPNNGKVEGVVDFSGLKQKVRKIPKLDVFNGIAYHNKRKTFFVTGKNWNKLFEVKIIKKENK